MSAASVMRFRANVGWRDLAWVAWRQHRSMIVTTGVIVLVLAAAMALVTISAATSGELPIVASSSMAGDILAACSLVFSALIAVFWAAPLLSREYEQRTHLVVWSQDVSAARWLMGKSLVLGGAAVVLALVVGTAAQLMVGHFDDTVRFVNPFEAPYFGVVPVTQVGYTLFGFALGLVFSVLTRRTVLSMGLTLGTLLLTRFLVGGFLRPHYQTPQREAVPFPENVHRSATPGRSGLTLDSGFLDSAGNPTDAPNVCGRTSTGIEEYGNCLREHGITERYVDFQPIERLDTFQLIEAGIFTGLAVLLLAATWRIIRRSLP